MPGKFELDRQVLEEYVNKGYGNKRIAKRLGCSHEKVRTSLKEYGLKSKHEYFDSTQAREICEECGEGNAQKLSVCSQCIHAAKRFARKVAFVKYLGGRCKHCGLESKDISVYEFHHRDPNEKEFEIAAKVRDHASLLVLKTEVDKCDLLCRNCHQSHHTRRFEHPELNQIVEDWSEKVLKEINQLSSPDCSPPASVQEQAAA